jgi:hypothetical protein
MSDLVVNNTTKERNKMKNITHTLVVCAVLFTCSSLSGAPSTGKASAQEKGFANEIMKATADENYQAFVADGDSGFKSITKAQFDDVCRQADSRLKAGYQVIFLGSLKQDDSRVTLWKISYSDGGNDDLLRMAVRDGKISGALLTPPF